MTVSEYHKIKALSSSKLKLYNESLFKFKRWFIDGVEAPQAKSASINIGNLVDFLLLRDAATGVGEENFNDVFTLYSGKAKGQMMEFVEELFNITQMYIANGEVSKSFKDLFQEAIDSFVFDQDGEQVKFMKIKKDHHEGILLEFNKSGADYYKVLRNNVGKDVITQKQMQLSEKLVGILKAHWVTRRLFSSQSKSGLDVINQFPFVFEYKGFQFKILIDKVLIDHNNKKIYIFDLKTTYATFQYERNFLDLGYYFQLGLYTYGMSKWIVEKNYTKYTIEPLKFVVCPTTYTEAPFKHEPQWPDYQKAFDGFKYRDKKYKGIDQIIEEITFHRDNGVWDMDKETYDNKGVRKLNLMQ